MIRRLLCKLGFHEWYMKLERDEYGVVTIPLTFPRGSFCKHCDEPHDQED